MALHVDGAVRDVFVIHDLRTVVDPVGAVIDADRLELHLASQAVVFPLRIKDLTQKWVKTRILGKPGLA